MFVLGTAGHIDHGKSVLVRALTGIDPDRLREEKDRGMTIDLGFAWLKLPGGQEVGIVDVPGHEHFIKNMLAGVGGIDLALLIVAASEGVMPQTREHLAILDLLGIWRGIVVVTKKDLVDEEWLDLVKLEVEELVSPTGLSRAPIIAVSAVTGEGLAGLVSVIDQLLSSAQPRKDIGWPRLPVDRVFTIAGAGTIVTGTLIDGTLSVGQEVEVVPSGIRSRLRGLQTHKTRIKVATPGSRVAANLHNIATSQLYRGDVIATPGWLIPSTVLDVKLHHLSYLRRPLLHNATVSFYTGSTETAARVRLMERKELQPGETSWAQLLLSGPVAVVKGDRFIIRSSEETLGGGDIIDPYARRHRRFRPALIQNLKVKDEGTVEEMIMALLEEKQPLELTTLLSQCNLPADEAKMAMETLVREGWVVKAGQKDSPLLMTMAGWESLVENASDAVQDYHQRFPARQGMPKEQLGGKLKLSPRSAVWQKFFDEGVLVREGPAVRLPSHQVQLTIVQQEKVDNFLRSLERSPCVPVSECMLETDLLRLLVERYQVVRVGGDIMLSAAAYEEMRGKVIDYVGGHGKITLAEARDIFGTNRKHAKALLEYMDEQGITRRVGDERVLR